MQAYKKYRKPSPYKKHRGSDIDTPAPEHRTHCNGCGKQHKPPCRLTYKYEYNEENKPYATSGAGLAAAARRKLEGKEALKVIDMLYTEKDKPDPSVSTSFKPYHQTTPYTGGRGRGSHESGEGCIQCNTLSYYLTSITNDGDNHLIPLSIKVAEADFEEDMDVEDNT